MASIKVAIRVRPLNQREIDLDSDFAVHIDGKKTSITNSKLPGQSIGDLSRDKLKEFTYDHSYWSVDSQDTHYVPQKQVFDDLGMDVVDSAYQGYNACVFAYGQTGSGKTYTMMGLQNDVGLIPRICQEMFTRMKDDTMSYRAEVSYLEIYNERVRDLLKQTGKTQHGLRVREHPKEGPYVQDLSKHIVMNFEDIKDLMDTGNSFRTTASTNMNDTSSRSHAIFTIVFTQARFSKDSPIETRSKIHLVDLAGSERADATGATGQRLKEGSSINKSLVTLGNVISALADLSEKTTSSRKNNFIPYRDSVLTWLLKDSLGGNAKTIMIATISPADCNYGETLSTLRYANRAKSIVNKPTINEDPNVKLIRELREEIARLRSLVGSNVDNVVTPHMQEKLHENEARVKVLTEAWQGRWNETASILEEETNLALRKEGLGVVLDSGRPHLIAIDDNILSTGIMLYHIKEGTTTIGTEGSKNKQDIVLVGEDVEEEHCCIENHDSVVTLRPLNSALCIVDGTPVTHAVELSQGAVMVLGRSNMFRFNHPKQAAKLRKAYRGSVPNLSRRSLLSQSMSDLYRSTDNLSLSTSGWDIDIAHKKQLCDIEQKRREIERMERQISNDDNNKTSGLEQRQVDLETQKKQLETMLIASARMEREADALTGETGSLTQHSVMDDRLTDPSHRNRDVFSNAGSLSSHNGEEGVTRGNDCKLQLRQAVLAEHEKLTEQERAKKEEAEKAKLALQQELQSLKDEQEKEKQAIVSQMLAAEAALVRQREALTEAEGTLLLKQKELEQQQIIEVDNLMRERNHLEVLKTDYKEFYRVAKEFEEDTQSRLREENKILSSKQLDIVHREKLMYDEYTQRRAEIETTLLEKKQEIVEEQEILEADKVYLRELEENFELLSPDRYADEERYKEDQEAIMEERKRITEVIEALREKEGSVQGEYEDDMEQLERRRGSDIDSINEAKEEFSDLQQKWSHVVQAEIKVKSDAMLAVERQMQEKRDTLQTMTDSISELQGEVVVREQQLADLQGALCDVERGHAEALQLAAAQVEHQGVHIDGEVEGDLSQIEFQLKSLHELLNSTDNWDDSQITLNAPSSSPQPVMCDEGDGVETDGLENMPCLDDNLKGFSYDLRIQQLSELEAQLGRVEDELVEEKKAQDIQRQQQLDLLDEEKYRLSELEHEERISALIEQEVRKRLYEEKVEREKKRKIEKERERLERERELWRLKKAHERDLDNMKTLYESSPVDNLSLSCNLSSSNHQILPNSNGDLQRNSSVRSSRSVSRTSMRHAQSLSSLSSLHGNSRFKVKENPFVVTIPAFVCRGSGFEAFCEFEVQMTVFEETWTIFRRYTKFREFHYELKVRYPEVAALLFPPKKWFGSLSEKFLNVRRIQLENYLQNVLNVLWRRRNCILHPSQTSLYSKQTLVDFHPFFRKGLFETSCHSTS